MPGEDGKRPVEPRAFEIDGLSGKQTFQTFPQAMQAFAKLERRHDHALTMQAGEKSVILATTSWQNDGSNAVPWYHSRAVENYFNALERNASGEQMRAIERAAQADIDRWPSPPKREQPGKAASSHEARERTQTGPTLNGEPLPEAKAPAQAARIRVAPDEASGMTLPDAVARKYLRDGDKLFRSGLDEKPGLTLRKDTGIRINDDAAIRDAVAIARHNGWQTIRVNGSDDFKKAVYLEASRAGLEVTGYKPAPQLKLEGERMAARDKAREAQDPAKAASMAKKDPTEARSAADQFRRNSHRENAANPQFQAAQSHVLAASIEARTRFPDKQDRDRFIEKVKESVAKRLETGSPVQAARFEQQQRQNEAERLTRENTVLRQPERSPTRGR